MARTAAIYFQYAIITAWTLSINCIAAPCTDCWVCSKVVISESEASSSSETAALGGQPSCLCLQSIAVNASRTCEHSLSRSEEHTSELQSLMRISYAVFCLKQQK